MLECISPGDGSLRRLSRKSPFPSFLTVRKKPLDLLCVTGIDVGSPSEVSFLLRGLAGQDVAVIGFFPLDFSAFQDGESFGRATIAFHLRHLQHSSFCGGQRAFNRKQTILNFFLYRIFSRETNNFFTKLSSMLRVFAQRCAGDKTGLVIRLKAPLTLPSPARGEGFSNPPP
jgi:hypothetical protein